MSLSGRRALALAATSCVAAGLAAPGAAANHVPPPGPQYEPAPPFCEGETVHDHLKPLKRMPKLNSAPASGRLEGLGFGPGLLRVRTLRSLVLAAPDSASPGRSYRSREAGYDLFSLRGSVKLDWEATTTLSRVDWRGRVVEIERQVRRRIASVYRGHGAGVRFQLDRRPAVYRLTAVFHSRSGRKLGGFGFYVRVVPPTSKARLALDAGSYRPGGTVFGRIENFGTTIARYGARYAIERFDGSTWALAPESPSVFILPLYGAGPGEAGSPCSRFWISPDMPTGRYRMSKEVSFEGGFLRHRSPEQTVTAEFDVLPAS